MTDRIARFEERRARLATLSDDQLRDRFWELTTEMMDPVVDLARTHTSPSIERSVLMRMGIDSVTCHPVVDAVQLRGLMGKGAGHVVLKLATRRGCSLTEAAAAIAEDPSVLDGLFEGK